MTFPIPCSEAADGERYVFGVHSLRPLQRELLRRAEPVAIGARAFDLLHALVQSPGQVISKREIFTAVWPVTLVDDSNLRFQVAMLRRALGPDADAVKTIPGRGYVFAARVERLETLADDLSSQAERAASAVPALREDTPSAELLTRLREENVLLKQALADLMMNRLTLPQGRRPWTDFINATGAAA